MLNYHWIRFSMRTTDPGATLDNKTKYRLSDRMEEFLDRVKKLIAERDALIVRLNDYEVGKTNLESKFEERYSKCYDTEFEAPAEESELVEYRESSALEEKRGAD